LEGFKNGGIFSTFNRTGDLLVSSGWEGRLRFWHPRSGKQVFDAPGDLLAHCFRPDRHQIAAWVRGPTDRGRGLWEVAAPREYRTLVHDPVPGRSPEMTVGSTHPNGRWLAVGGTDGPRLWDLVSGRQLAWLPV